MTHADTRAVEGGGGGGRTYKRDPKGSETGGQFTASPAPITSAAYQAAYKAAGQPRQGSGSKAAPTAPRSSSKFKTLALGENNDPATVNELQRLLSALGISVGLSGVYDEQTEQAVKAVQRKLGIKNPNGKASRSLVNALLNAYDLSPCLNPGT
jgi:peptidoglycan hydrolase-like protein with peptidoglycan-binding domain